MRREEPHRNKKGRRRVDTDILTSSLRLAADLLDTTRRAWIIGIANLAGLPDDTPPMDEEKIRTVIEIASSTADFPAARSATSGRATTSQARTTIAW